MKYFLIKTVIIGIVVMVFLVVTELLVESIPNEYSYKNNYLESNIDKINTLVVGSSVGRSGVNPDYLDGKAFNCANNSQDIELDCEIVNRCLEGSSGLNTVVFTLIPGSYVKRLCENTESWRLRKFSLYMKLNVEGDNLKEHFEISNPNAAIKQIIKWISGEPTIDCFESGMGSETDIQSEREKISNGLYISGVHNKEYNPRNYDIIVPRMKKTIQKCLSRKIDVYLVLLPAYSSYRENINKKMLEECDSISKSIAASATNIHYFNLFNDASFVPDDFKDSNHLSQQGAKKLSIKLNKIIKSLK